MIVCLQRGTPGVGVTPPCTLADSHSSTHLGEALWAFHFPLAHVIHSVRVLKQPMARRDRCCSLFADGLQDTSSSNAGTPPTAGKPLRTGLSPASSIPIPSSAASRRSHRFSVESAGAGSPLQLGLPVAVVPSAVSHSGLVTPPRPSGVVAFAGALLARHRSIGASSHGPPLNRPSLGRRHQP